MKKTLFILFVFIVPFLSNAQPEEKKFGITFSGFVKTDIFWDSRQTEDFRDGHFLLFPKNELLDKDGNDINATPSFNFLNIQTRLRGDITGPDALGAKTSGAIEGEFFGMANTDINGFRLRHAYVKLNWKTTELMVGQFWHPMFITSCFPEVVSFNTGAPFLPFTRNPQIRFTQNFGNFKIIITALSQLDFKSNGPEGLNTKYIRNSSMPAMNLNLEYSRTFESSGTSLLVGIAGDYKRLVPRMKTDSGYKTNESVGSMIGTAYVKLGLPKVSIKLFGLYGQDVNDFTMVGGYAETMITDSLKWTWEYTPLTTFSTWAEVMTNGKKMQAGLFLAYSKSLGATEDIHGSYYARGYDSKNKDYIGYLWRISPRFIYNIGKLRLAPEIEYTVAGYGKIDNKGIVDDPKAIGNFRFLLGVYYFF